MSRDFAGTGERVLTGRVLAVPSPGSAFVLSNGHRVSLLGPVSDLVPGDLVRVRATHATAEGARDATYRASRVEVVFRPTRQPFGPDTETGRLLGGGLDRRLQLRARILAAIRGYFVRSHFLEVETPAVATSPGLDLHLHAFSVSPSRGSQDSSPWGYLITSPEYHMKRLLVGGIDRCFQLARCFRAEELGARHESEFTMLEWYRAWATADEMLSDTEQVLRAATDSGPTPGHLIVDGARVSLDEPFERLTVREAFARYASGEGDPIELAVNDEERFFRTMVDRIEPHLGRGRPTFLTHFPASQASLARLSPGDPSVCERFELYVQGVELSNGFVELTDPVEQRTRLERDQAERARRGLPVYPIDERFLRALEEGMPPSVGNALGLDRLVALVSGCTAVADVMAFPYRSR